MDIEKNYNEEEKEEKLITDENITEDMSKEWIGGKEEDKE